MKVSAGTRATVTCTGPCNYVVIATLGDKAQQSDEMEAIVNRVVSVKADKESCRPGEEIVVKAAFDLMPASPAELALLKWKCEPSMEGLLSGMAAQHLKFEKEGNYKVYAFVHSPAKNVVANVKVTQPKLKRAAWLYRDLETEKKITGWEEKNTVQLTFESAQGMELELTVGINRAGTFHPFVKPFVFQVEKDNENRMSFLLSKAQSAGKVVEGEYLVVQLKPLKGEVLNYGEVSSPKLKFTEQEQIGGIAFFKNGKRVSTASYGDKLRCRHLRKD